MPAQVRSYELVIAPGSTRAAPVTVSVAFPPFYVESIEVDVPSGPNGNVGFQIASSRQQIIPWNAGQWIVPNNTHYEWPSAVYPSSGDWQVIAYNTGQYSHTIWVRFNVNPVGVTPVPAVVPVSLDAASQLPATMSTDTIDLSSGIDLSSLAPPLDLSIPGGP